MEEAKPKRVLLVDDDLDVLRNLRRMLERSGFDAKVALTADQALGFMDSEVFDAVVVDFNMQGPNGAWLLREVRKRHPRTARLLLSGSTYTELVGHLEPGLVDAFLGKPLGMEELKAGIDGAVG